MVNGAINQLVFLSYIEHEWTLKSIGSNPWPSDKHGSHWDGFGNWNEKETIHVVADLKICKIRYYKIPRKGKKKILLKEDKLTPGERYYFALCCDGDKNCVVFESV